MGTGDVFSGLLELGPATIHDENAGYDLRADVVYTINSYMSAKARADADCPPPAHVRNQSLQAASPASVPRPRSTRG